jgi:NifB/MoaA-like Fe-S oxidoreductase
LEEALPGLSARAFAVDNAFYGPGVTVSGLLTGRDVIERLKRADIGDLGDCVYLPRGVLRENTEIFLDDLSLSDVGAALGVSARAAGSCAELAETLGAG